MAIRKLNKSDYRIGQKVALRYDNNLARGNRYGYVVMEITKIGNKILYCGAIKIDMETGFEKSNYAPDYILYDSEQHLLDTFESERLFDAIANKLSKFGGYPDISLNKLKQIAEILEIE